LNPSLNNLVAAAAVFFSASLHAAIEGGNQLSIDFTKQEDATAKALWWSRPEKLGLTAQGLGWDESANTSVDGWIHTKPLAVGMSWRPAVSVMVRLTIDPTPKEITLPNGQTYTPFIGQAFARFSPDSKHWSTWQVLNTTYPLPKDATGRLFTGRLGVPQSERLEYTDLLQAYARLDVPWRSDEEALVAWILAKDPKFFERSLPFIGYVEFLFEASFQGGQRITALKADVSYVINGVHQAARDPEAARNRGGLPWRFKSP